MIDPSGSEKAAISPATGLFYRLMVAFPVWAGAFLAVRALFHLELSCRSCISFEFVPDKLNGG